MRRRFTRVGHVAMVVKTVLVPFWGGCTFHFSFFVGIGNLTHGHVNERAGLQPNVPSQHASGIGGLGLELFHRRQDIGINWPMTQQSKARFVRMSGRFLQKAAAWLHGRQLQWECANHRGMSK